MEHFVQTLLTMTATAAVVAVAVMILRLPLKRAPRWITCCLWLVVFLRMVCPAGLSLPVSLVPQAISEGASVERVFPAAQQQEAPAGLPAVTEEDAAQQGETTTTPAAVYRAVSPQTEPLWPAVLTGVWGTGVTATLLWAALSYGRLRRRIADAIRMEGNLYETDRIDTPFVCGFFRPRIYLPVGLAQEDRRYVLLHEQAHIRRGDHLTKPLFYLALCVHWFNPVLWLAYWLLCRDIETACDQAVIRTFNKADTAQYAAALLHLGRGPSLPTVVPLAFGEENATGRIRSVLAYKKPAFWLVLAAAALCVAAGVLLLADRATPPAQLEGREIAQASVIETLSWSGWWGDSPSFPTQVALPEDLTQALVSLLDQTEHGTFAYIPTPKALPDRTVTLSSADGSATYYFLEEDGALVLYRLLNDLDKAIWRRAVLDEALADSPDYQAWRYDLEYYLAIGRAEDLYQLKVRHIGNPDAVTDILDALSFEAVAGPYTVGFRTEELPYTVTLSLENMPRTMVDDSIADDYFAYVGFVLLSLLDNANQIEVLYPGEEPILIPFGITKETDPDLVNPSLETFRQTFAVHHGDLTPYSPGAPTGRCYAVEKLLYWDPDLVELSQATEAETKALYQSAHFVLRNDQFALRLGNGTQEIGFPVFYDTDPYEDAPLSQVLTAPDGQTFDLSGPEGEMNYASALINRETLQDSGYRFYLQGHTLYVAYFSLEDGRETLAYLAQIALDPS